MIRVTRLDGSVFYVNAEYIQTVESTPDTHIVLVTGTSSVVQEKDHEIVEQVMAYRHAAYGRGTPPTHLQVVQG